MDEASKELLKWDLFCQGLLLKWQEKILSSAETFADALHQARTAEEQQRQLSMVHSFTSTSNYGFSKSHAVNSSDKVHFSDKEKTNIEKLLLTKTPPKERFESPLPRCFNCHSTHHLLKDCRMRKSLTEASGRVGNSGTSNCAISSSRDESNDGKCHQLHEEWKKAEFA